MLPYIISALPDRAMGEAIDVLVEAFSDDPGMGWVTGGDAAQLRRWMDAGLELFQLVGQPPLAALREDGRVLGVLTFLPPGFYIPPWEELRWLFRVGRRLSPVAAVRTGRILRAAESFHPEVPFHYLVQLGVRREVLGKGVGRALMEEAKAVCVAHPASQGLWLETELSEKVAWYQRQGFHTLGTVSLSRAVRSTGMCWVPEDGPGVR